VKILVTGAAGYIGSVLVPKLLDKHVVVALDNFRYAQHQALASCCGNLNFDIINGDARDMRLVEPLLRNMDAIIPLAAIVGAPACAKDETSAISTNYNAIRQLCQVASRNQLIIYPNTNSGYGTTGINVEAREETLLRPISLYGKVKAQAEEVVMQRSNSITLRLATVFGVSPRMRTDLLVNDFVQRAVTDRTIGIFQGHARRNFIHVNDVAEAFIHGLRGNVKLGEVYNVGRTDANYTKIALCELISVHIKDFRWYECRGEDPDQRDYIVNNDKIEDTGWKPKISLGFGIHELIQFYKMAGATRFTNV